jgi:hypothetical protein
MEAYGREEGEDNKQTERTLCPFDVARATLPLFCCSEGVSALAKGKPELEAADTFYRSEGVPALAKRTRAGSSGYLLS